MKWSCDGAEHREWLLPPLCPTMGQEAWKMATGQPRRTQTGYSDVVEEGDLCFLFLILQRELRPTCWKGASCLVPMPSLGEWHALAEDPYQDSSKTKKTLNCFSSPICFSLKKKKSTRMSFSLCFWSVPLTLLSPCSHGNKRAQHCVFWGLSTVFLRTPQ